jgi:DNA-binding NarL/FixJ family response regulator
MTTPLTTREVEVLALVADGNSNRQIAGILDTSEQTIKNHISVILSKLKANDRAHAVAIAVCGGMIPVRSVDEANNQRSCSLRELLNY